MSRDARIKILIIDVHDKFVTSKFCQISRITCIFLILCSSLFKVRFKWNVTIF